MSNIDLTAGLTEKQLALHPYCEKCNWRCGGLDSWDGVACKCGVQRPNFRRFLTAAAKHEDIAERMDALDEPGDADDGGVAAAFHATRAEDLRLQVAQAFPTCQARG